MSEKKLSGKAAAIKRFENSPLGKELNKIPSQIQENSNLEYNNFNFKKFNITMKSLMSFLLNQNANTFKIFSTNKFKKVKSRIVETKKGKVIVINEAPKLFNDNTEKLANEYIRLANAEKKGFVLDAILVIYFFMIMIIVIFPCHH